MRAFEHAEYDHGGCDPDCVGFPLSVTLVMPDQTPAEAVNHVSIHIHQISVVQKASPQLGQQCSLFPKKKIFTIARDSVGAAVVVACTTSIFAQSVLTARSAKQGGRMKGSFVFIFRQGSRKLTAAEQARRTEEVRAWALQRLKDDSGFDPRVLSDESYRLQNDTTAANKDGSVTALNFIEAADFDEAVKIAKTHPGLRYGVSIEVRPWKDPRVQPPPTR
jgi:hypothetical protein